MLLRPPSRSHSSSAHRPSRSLAFGLASLAVGSVAVAAGCGDSGTGGTGGTGGAGGGNSKIECPEAPNVSGCTVAVKASADDYTAIETALGEAKSGSQVCLCPGTFKVSRELDLATQGITFRGAGAAPTDTVVDFATQQSMGDKSIAVTGGDFTISNMWVKNSPGDGVDVTGVTGVTFKDLKVSWDAGSATTNGAYAVYPVKCTNVLVDNVEVNGAADAGIYVGQSKNAIVQNSTVSGSVAGIESENTTDMEIMHNKVFDNTAGILIFALPNLEKKDALRTNVHDNDIHDNNRPNFAVKGSTVASVPVGIGILILAADQAEVHGNTITNANSVGLTMVSGDTFGIISGKPWNDPMTDQFPEGNFIHDNTFTGCGTMPDTLIAALVTPPVASILWDGSEKTMGMADLCLGATGPWPTFINANGDIADPSKQTTDTTPFQCNGTALTPITL
jgi:parallel beta-helix repeat protein